MPWLFRGLLVSLLVSLCACANFRKTGNLEGNAMEEASKSEVRQDEASSEDVETNIEKPYKSSYGEISLDYNEYVEKWIRYFQGRGRPHMEVYLSRSTRYLPMMKNVLRENGLPEDLVYIALIESGFSPKAHSRANAVGYWQFIRGTGKRFGLKLDTFTDERRDPVLSTRAAAEYFKALYSLFGSWHLAMASYNVGEMRVKRAVTKHYTRDFWALLKKRRALPAETRNYVPKFIAAAMIAKDPKKYGFTNIEYADPLSYDTVTLKSPISFQKLANNLSVDVDELRLLNPKFRTDYVPLHSSKETVLRIPVGRATDALAALSMSVTSQPKIIQAEYYYYRVRRGDNLSTIAKRHRTTVSTLRRLNNLSNRTLLSIGRRLRVPDNGGDGIKVVTEEDIRSPSSASGAVPAVQMRDVEYHVVRRGENLSVIARRYGLSVQEILQLNNLSARGMIFKGQRLRVRPEPMPKSTRRAKNKSRTQAMQRELRTHMAASSSKKSSKVRRHTVRRGETLYGVSKKYGLSLSQLAKANDVKISHRVMAGERLVIPD